MCNLNIFRYFVLFYHAHVSAIRWLGVCFMIFRLVLLSGRLNVFKSTRCSCYLDGVCVAFESRFFFIPYHRRFEKNFHSSYSNETRLRLVNFFQTVHIVSHIGPFRENCVKNCVLFHMLKNRHLKFKRLLSTHLAQLFFSFF